MHECHDIPVLFDKEEADVQHLYKYAKRHN